MNRDDVMHPGEETLAACVLGLLSDTESTDITAHVAACPACERTVGELRATVAALRLWCEPPADRAEAAYAAVVQRMRLHRLLEQLFADRELRRQVSEDPAGALAAHGIAPTPALLAAFGDLAAPGGDRFPGTLDERLTKIRRLLEWFPGAPPPLGN